jgi:hypothetical protein
MPFIQAELSGHFRGSQAVYCELFPAIASNYECFWCLVRELREARAIKTCEPLLEDAELKKKIGDLSSKELANHRWNIK